MSVVSLSATTTMTTGSLQFPLIATIVGSLCGVILLSIVVVIVVISLLFREKIRGIIILLCNCVKKLELSRAHNYKYPHAPCVHIVCINVHRHESCSSVYVFVDNLCLHFTRPAIMCFSRKHDLQ